jgi:hypothetical protein
VVYLVLETIQGGRDTDIVLISTMLRTTVNMNVKREEWMQCYPKLPTPKTEAGLYHPFYGGLIDVTHCKNVRVRIRARKHLIILKRDQKGAE